jgi:hypothetical protein
LYWLIHKFLNIWKPFFYDSGTVSTGLGLITATIILSGEMAGSGVLALPSAMVGTGKFKSNWWKQYTTISHL